MIVIASQVHCFTFARGACEPFLVGYRYQVEQSMTMHQLWSIFALVIIHQEQVLQVHLLVLFVILYLILRRQYSIVSSM